jgi:cellulose synthase/poly-beta-1,6-N-acetylglucosamine synthase-like glycosyltransferase
MNSTRPTLTERLATSFVRASVIIPAYNAEQFIARAINSALAQAERRLEVIVIDDASTDATASVVAEIASHDGSVHLLQRTRSILVLAPRAPRLEHASGD